MRHRITKTENSPHPKTKRTKNTKFDPKIQTPKKATKLYQPLHPNHQNSKQQTAFYYYDEPTKYQTTQEHGKVSLM